MNDLSVSEEYLLCALGEKGKISTLAHEIPVCMLAAALLELLASGTIKIDDKNKVHIRGSLGQEKRCLKSLYYWLKDTKPMTVGKIAEKYILGFSGKQLNALIADIGHSLARKNCVTATEKSGIFGNKMLFIPRGDAVDQVIEKIRGELLGKEQLSDETVALVSLLEKSKLIKKYFSKDESGRLKARLKEIRAASSNQLIKQMMDYIDEIITVIIVASTAH